MYMYYVSGTAGAMEAGARGAGGERRRTRSFIQLRDREFLGEDRALQAELARRGAGGGGARARLPRLDLSAPGATARMRKLQALRPWSSPHHYQPRLPTPDDDVEPRRNDTNGSRRAAADHPAARTHLEKNRHEKAFIYMANMRMSMALSLQLMEQAIYTVQYRFMDIKKYTSRYANDNAFRIAYILRQMRDWVYEMRVWHKWLSDTLNYENDTMGVFVSLLYYQYMVRNHVDLTQSVYYVIDLHEAIVAKYPSDHGPKDPGPPLLNDSMPGGPGGGPPRKN